MADKTGIEWTDATWNPLAGCSIVSPGCTNCYAMKVANGLERRFGSEKYRGLTKVVNGNPVWTGEVRAIEDALDQPMRWKKPRRIFVNSMSDLFHEAVADETIDRVFAVMALSPQHTFQVLTKRAERMRDYLTASTGPFDTGHAMGRIATLVERTRKARGEWNGLGPLGHLQPGDQWWPLANVWLGVSVEDQKRADERIPHLLATPAAKRFISAEPLLGPLDLTGIVDRPDCATITDALQGCRGHNIGADEDGRVMWDGAEKTPKLDWVIAGGESGPSARPMHPEWARALRDQCAGADVPFFFKQWGAWHPGDQVKDARQIEAGGDMGHALRDGRAFEFPDQWTWRVGKKASGWLLDGREHREFPHD